MLKLFTATAIAFCLVSVMAYPVSAETAEQNQNLEVKCETTTSGYGQTSNNCKVLGTQTQKITLRKGVKPVTQLENTGLDTTVSIVSALTVAGGAVATYLKVRNQA